MRNPSRLVGFIVLSLSLFATSSPAALFKTKNAPAEFSRRVKLAPVLRNSQGLPLLHQRLSPGDHIEIRVKVGAHQDRATGTVLSMDDQSVTLSTLESNLPGGKPKTLTLTRDSEVTLYGMERARATKADLDAVNAILQGRLRLEQHVSQIQKTLRLLQTVSRSRKRSAEKEAQSLVDSLSLLSAREATQIILGRSPDPRLSALIQEQDANGKLSKKSLNELREFYSLEGLDTGALIRKANSLPFGSVAPKIAETLEAQLQALRLRQDNLGPLLAARIQAFDDSQKKSLLGKIKSGFTSADKTNITDHELNELMATLDSAGPVSEKPAQLLQTLDTFSPNTRSLIAKALHEFDPLTAEMNTHEIAPNTASRSLILKQGQIADLEHDTSEMRKLSLLEIDHAGIGRFNGVLQEFLSSGFFNQTQSYYEAIRAAKDGKNPASSHAAMEKATIDYCLNPLADDGGPRAEKAALVRIKKIAKGLRFSPLRTEVLNAKPATEREVVSLAKRAAEGLVAEVIADLTALSESVTHFNHAQDSARALKKDNFSVLRFLTNIEKNEKKMSLEQIERTQVLLNQLSTELSNAQGKLAKVPFVDLNQYAFESNLNLISQAQAGLRHLSENHPSLGQTDAKELERLKELAQGYAAESHLYEPHNPQKPLQHPFSQAARPRIVPMLADADASGSKTPAPKTTWDSKRKEISQKYAANLRDRQVLTQTIRTLEKQLESKKEDLALRKQIAQENGRLQVLNWELSSMESRWIAIAKLEQDGTQPLATNGTSRANVKTAAEQVAIEAQNATGALPKTARTQALKEKASQEILAFTSAEQQAREVELKLSFPISAEIPLDKQIKKLLRQAHQPEAVKSLKPQAELLSAQKEMSNVPDGSRTRLAILTERQLAVQNRIRDLEILNAGLKANPEFIMAMIKAQDFGPAQLIPVLEEGSKDLRWIEFSPSLESSVQALTDQLSQERSQLEDALSTLTSARLAQHRLNSDLKQSRGQRGPIAVQKRTVWIFKNGPDSVRAELLSPNSLYVNSVGLDSIPGLELPILNTQGSSTTPLRPINANSGLPVDVNFSQGEVISVTRNFKDSHEYTVTWLDAKTARPIKQRVLDLSAKLKDSNPRMTLPEIAIQGDGSARLIISEAKKKGQVLLEETLQK